MDEVAVSREWPKFVQNASWYCTDCSRGVVVLYFSGSTNLADVNEIDE